VDRRKVWGLSCQGSINLTTYIKDVIIEAAKVVGSGEGLSETDCTPTPSAGGGQLCCQQGGLGGRINGGVDGGFGDRGRAEGEWLNEGGCCGGVSVRVRQVVDVRGGTISGGDEVVEGGQCGMGSEGWVDSRCECEAAKNGGVGVDKIKEFAKQDGVGANGEEVGKGEGVHSEKRKGNEGSVVTEG
jgi:hypothetical protein